MDEDRHAPNLDDAASGKTDLGMLYYLILPKKKAFMFSLREYDLSI